MRISKKWKRAVCLSAAAAVVLGGGFMGIQSFSPEKRTITIVEESSPVSAEAGSGLEIEGKSAVLIDGNSGEVLFEQNSKEHLPPASVTKVMTLLLIMEGCKSGKISMEDKVTISGEAAGMGGSQMYMEEGEVHTVEELVKGVIMVSANDACVALAEHLSGSAENFADSMNRRAEEMGLEDSNFVNTNGLPVADHYSCAYDIGMISKELMKYREVREWFTKWQDEVQVGLPGKEKSFTLTNTNRLIRSYRGAVGIKTGFTEDAGYCLSAAAERDSAMMIGVVLGCESSDIRFDEMTKLLDYGFANYETVIIADRGERIEKINIEKGNKRELFAAADEKVGITTEKGNAEAIRTEAVIYDNIKLPVKKGDKVGSLKVYEGDRKKGEWDLTADRAMEKADFKTIYIRMIKKLL
ncbi:MAG TPA: D-alanyl-D-alanine carboxypeptidase [Candidatus Copromorpha excrementigallinarum]|uniref:serine-type D-Ala-D-Ala carboxypeptidase n=1 Tax=Candidatus Allocopromorpha excrementigallinarum TaxID=2840742 RepID=A0A9D1I0Z7_9FIRM|nr:D-alanyl-D-alanine carboxypeptidase [Candidatus Copromorpha excrementigallinarum]